MESKRVRGRQTFSWASIVKLEMEYDHNREFDVKATSWLQLIMVRFVWRGDSLMFYKS